MSEFNEDDMKPTRGRKVAESILAKIRAVSEEVEQTDECMTDTSMSDVAQSAKGEVYKKTSEKSTAPAKATGEKTGVVASKTGEAYNTTAVTKRMPALESAIRGVMSQTFEQRKIYNESAQIAIVTPEQRNDWMQVEQGKMPAIDYFQKYRVEGE